MDITSITLKVIEANSKDTGRGIIRLDPKDFKKIDIEVGDVVQVKGKRVTAAKVMPAYIEDREKDLVRLDGITRDNAQIGLDEKVIIQKAVCNPAGKISVTPLTQVRSFDSKYIGTLLEGIPLVNGDIVRAKLFGAKTRDFKVTATKPDGIVIIKPDTIIEIKEEKSEFKSSRVSYEDIGGLAKEIHRIREMIELPLKYPQVFEKLGIDPPKGVLLHGPPGCGKTLIARAVANETDANFQHLTGPDIMAKFYGESEANLRKIFEKASAAAPAIIFFDEIDAIAPKREDMGGEKQVEKRVVAQLLALMDGLSSRGQVIVIGATNIPNVIDPALRRPGRFDREIEISIPDKNGRYKILNIHTHGMPLSEDVDLVKLSEITHGYVGADIEALCREAAMVSLRRFFPTFDFGQEEIPIDSLLDLKVTMDDFLEAMKEIEPSAIREVFSEVPNVKWIDVGGLEDVKNLLKETVEWPLKYASLFDFANTRPARGILFHGEPGTGKTLLAKAVATESGVNFISIKGPELLSRWVGDSEKGIRQIFKKARQASPCVVFFDEIDSLTPKRGAFGSSAVTDRVISQFLSEMDGIEELKGILVLAATNRIDMIDAAMLRSGRFDFQLELKNPDKNARIEIFKVHTRGKPLGKKINFDRLADETDTLKGADIELICNTAAITAIKEFIKKGRKDHTKFTILMKHFEHAIKKGQTR
ncbi:MAG: CDC48 family AAA ATPase [Proteobacteria bacterium]|nr:CDC48 family AAA ATPase [Pseudomonadota bacterium]MBU1585172.1 CDC48 family AAA ATPase [Pseudomonadota bacterium]MBU2454485.1 CDC48 family AAA ATPase [Pseudomonadota bacterium]MBU2629062.1 CDC48 family AAA ATPase [Pseudomonadota bacterium]